MNKNTRRNKLAERADGKHFHGKPCITCFASRERNPDNKRRAAYSTPENRRRS